MGRLLGLLGHLRVAMPRAFDKSYHFPIFCVAFVRYNHIFAAEGDASEERILLALGGGGGLVDRMIPCTIVITDVDLTAPSLSKQPVFEMEFGYRDRVSSMAVHPGGEGIVFSSIEGCRWLVRESSDILASEKTLTQLEDAPEQVLAFNAEGSMLASGGRKDGHLRVFKWPSMDIILDDLLDAHTVIRDLDFSSDGRFLVSLGSNDTCRVWDMRSSTLLASLENEHGEAFHFCKFSRSTDDKVLFVVGMQGGGEGMIVSWNTESWNRIKSKNIVRPDTPEFEVSCPISAFNVSADGKLLAVGTSTGGIVILNSDLQILKNIKEAHCCLVIALLFSPDTRALVSASYDHWVRVTPLEGLSRSIFGIRIGAI